MIASSIIPGLVCSLALAASPLMTAGREAGPTESGPLTNVWNRDVAAKASALFQALPAPAIHYAGLPEAEARQRLRAEAAYQQLMREKLEGQWFAALVATEGAEPGSIQFRFKTWRGLVEFLAEQNALVEVWACGEAGDHKVRRIPAAELAEAKQQRHEPPALLTVTCQDRATGPPDRIPATAPAPPGTAAQAKRTTGPFRRLRVRSR
jgi:hypothetical protein